MKKILLIILAATLIFCAFSFASFAEASTDTTENAVDTAETLTNPAEIDLKGVYDQVIGIVTNGEIWAKIGVTVLGILALIVSVRSCFGKIENAFRTFKDMIAGKATKEETKKAVDDGISSLKSEFEHNHAALSDKYDALSKKYDKQTAILSLVTMHLIKSPNARVQIMNFISDSKEIGGDVVEYVNKIEEAIEEAEKLEPKIETPALDEIISEQDTKSADTEPAYMMLN